MKLSKEHLALYAVTDRRWTGKYTLAEQVQQAINGGAGIIQLREKDADYETFLQIAKELREITEKAGVPFLINDNIDVALAVNADGIHIGQSDTAAKKAREVLGPDKIIGVSAQTTEQAIAAELAGADYLGIGAVFPTSSKDDAAEVPHSLLKEICMSVKIPVVAIGGITEDNLTELAGSGICGVAVISAIFAQSDIKKASENLLSAVKQYIL